jgi:hypothetical protein
MRYVSAEVVVTASHLRRQFSALSHVHNAIEVWKARRAAEARPLRIQDDRQRSRKEYEDAILGLAWFSGHGPLVRQSERDHI